MFLDDVSVSPVPPDVLASWTSGGARTGGKPEKAAAGSASKSGGKADDPLLRLDRNRLRRMGNDRRYHDWLPTAIDAPGADVTELRRHGFDLLVDDRKSGPERMQSAIDKGFLLLTKLAPIAPAADTESLLREIESYPYKDFVAFWQIGEGLGRKRDLKSRESSWPPRGR